MAENTSERIGAKSEHLTIEDQIALLRADMQDVKELLKAYADTFSMNDDRLMSIKDIARFYGCTVQTLYTSLRWKLPNYGKKVKGETLMYSAKELKEWNDRDPGERIREYRSLRLQKGDTRWQQA